MLGTGIIEIVKFYVNDNDFNAILDQKSEIVRGSEVALSMAEMDSIYEKLVYEKLKEALVNKEGIDVSNIKYHTNDLGIDGVGHSDFILYGESLWSKKQLDKLLDDNSGVECDIGRNLTHIVKGMAWGVIGRKEADIVTNYFRKTDYENNIFIYRDSAKNIFHAFFSMDGGIPYHSVIGDSIEFNRFISHCYNIDFKVGKEVLRASKKEHEEATEKGIDWLIPF